MYALNRTLILGLGPAGLAVAQAVKDRLEVRSLRRAPVAFLALVPPETAPTTVGAQGVLHAVPPRAKCCRWATPAGPRIETETDAAAAGIVAALGQVSRIGRPAPSPDSATGWPSPAVIPRSAGVDVYLVAALDDDLADAIVEVASLARRVIRRRLGAPARLSAVLLAPDPLAEGDPTPALERAHEVLGRIDSLRQSQDGDRQSSDGSLPIEEADPVFDGPCYLLGALNQHGLALASWESRRQMVAETVVQLAATPLGRAVELPAPSVRAARGRPGYASPGIGALVYPARMVHETLARRLAGEILALWPAGGLTDGPQNTSGDALATSQAGSFLTANELSSEGVGQRIVPGELLMRVGLDRPLQVHPGWGDLPQIADLLDEAATRRIEQLNARRPDLEDMARQLAAELDHLLGDELCRRLEATPPAGLRESVRFVAALKATLSGQADAQAQAAGQLWQRLQDLESESEVLGATLARQAQALPASWRGLVGALLRPDRWWGLWRTWRALQGTRAAYAASLERRLRLTAEILRCDLVGIFLAAGIQAVDGQARRLATLAAAVEAALESLNGPPEGGTAPATADPNAGQRGSPAKTMAGGGEGNTEGRFELEWSLVTPEILDALYAEHETTAAHELAGFADAAGPLSAWIADVPDGQAIVEAVLAYARRRLAWVAEVEVTDLLARLSSQRAGQHAIVRALSEAAAPFTAWDELVASPPDGQPPAQVTLLGVPAVAVPAFEAMFEEAHCPVRVVPTPDRQRITVLRIVWGVPFQEVGAKGV